MKYKRLAVLILFSMLFLAGFKIAKASVLNDSFINLLNNKSMNAVGSLHFELTAPSYTSTLGQGQSTEKKYMNVSLQSAQDFWIPGAIKSDQIFTVGTNLIPLVNSKLEMRLIGDTIYIKIPALPYEKLVPWLASYKDQWVQFGKNDAAAIAQENPSIQQSIEKIYNELVLVNSRPIAELAKVGDFIKKYSSVITEKKVGSRTIDGVAQNKYSLTLNTKLLIAKLTSNINSPMGTASRNYQIKEIEASVASFKLKNGVIYVGKKDHLPYELSFTIQQYDSVNKKVTSTFNFDFTFSDFGSHLNNITTPASFMTATDFYTNVIKKSLDTARAKAQQATLKTSLSDMRSTAELVYGNSNSYGTTSNMGNCSNPAFGSLFNPTTTISSGNQNSVNMQIKSILNNVINYSSSSLCYSTPSSWAMQAIYTDNSGSFCVDSTGVAKETTVSISGPICKN